MSNLVPVESMVQQHLAATVPAPAPTDIPPGVYVQIYRGAIHGATAQAKRDTLAGYLDQLVTLGCPGVVFHGFCEDLERNWDGLATLAHDRGLLALAAWGLDSKDITATRKGELIGEVLARPSCAAGLLDAEGQWDSDLGAADDMDEAGALALCKALRAKAPNALVGDQPWYAIDSHGEVRRTAKPIDQGGVFGGFPVDEFATVCNLGRFRQAYIYPSSGYAYTFARMDREWATITPALRAAGLERPLRVTVQGYRWPLHHLVDCLLNRCVTPRVPLMMWAEPFPDAVAIQAIRAVQWLQREGFAFEGFMGDAAVGLAQRELNQRGAKLVVDGWFGAASYAAAGLA